MTNDISLLDKVKVVVEMTKSNVFYAFIIAFLLIISFLFITTNKNNAKESKRTFGSLYAIALIIILIKYANSLTTMADYMMNNLFIVFYFPNIAVYLASILITNIIMWISLFNSSTKTSIKVLNSIIFSIIHYVLILILNIITTKKIDVFNQKELYANHDIHALIELTSNIFLIWILFLIFYKIIYTYLEKKRQDKVYERESLNVEHIKDTKKEHDFTINLPENVIKVKAPYLLKRETSTTRIVYELPKQTENTAIYEQMLTLDDYKLLVSLLKEEKAKGVKTILKNANSQMMEEENSKSLEKIESQKNKTVQHENRLSELMELYKSVG